MAAGRDQFHFRRLHHLFPGDIKGPIKVPVKPDVKVCSGGPVKRQAPPPNHDHDHDHGAAVAAACLLTESSQTLLITTSKNCVFPSLLVSRSLFFSEFNRHQREAFSQRCTSPPPPPRRRAPLGLITSSSPALALPCPPRVSFGITEMLTRLCPPLIFKTKGYRCAQTPGPKWENGRRKKKGEL